MTAAMGPEPVGSGMIRKRAGSCQSRSTPTSTDTNDPKAFQAVETRRKGNSEYKVNEMILRNDAPPPGHCRDKAEGLDEKHA